MPVNKRVIESKMTRLEITPGWAYEETFCEECGAELQSHKISHWTEIGGYFLCDDCFALGRGDESNTMTKTTNDTDYGYAANGTHVGSGFDVEVKRASRNSALVCCTSLATKQEWMTRLDVEQDADLQALAVEIGNCPELGNEGWVADSHPEWDEYAAQWDAL